MWFYSMYGYLVQANQIQEIINIYNTHNDLFQLTKYIWYRYLYWSKNFFLTDEKHLSNSQWRPKFHFRAVVYSRHCVGCKLWSLELYCTSPQTWKSHWYSYELTYPNDVAKMSWSSWCKCIIRLYVQTAECILLIWT